MSRIAVTGATGFVGRHVLRKALSRGHKLRALVRDPSGAPFANEIDVVHWDAAKTPTQEVFRDIEVVCHTAAFIPKDMSDVSIDTAEHCFSINAIGTLRLLQMCTAAGVQRVVNISSANAYASGNSKPAEEWPVFPSPRAPLYLVSKVAQEVIAEHWRLSGHIETCTLRLSSVYGSDQTSGFIPTFIRRLRDNHSITLKTGGSFGADFVHVDDVAAATLRAVESNCSGIFNIGSGNRITVLEIVDALLKELQADRKLVTVEPAGAAPEWGFPALDITKAAATLDYKPRSFAEGIKEQIQWTEEHDNA